MSHTPEHPSQDPFFNHPDLSEIDLGKVGRGTHGFDPRVFEHIEGSGEAAELARLADIPVGARLAVRGLDSEGHDRWTVFIRTSQGKDEDWITTEKGEDGRVTIEPAQIVGAGFPHSSIVETGVVRNGRGLEYLTVEREQFRSGAEAKDPRWASFIDTSEMSPDMVRINLKLGSLAYRETDGALVHVAPEYTHAHNTGIVLEAHVELPEHQ